MLTNANRLRDAPDLALPPFSAPAPDRAEPTPYELYIRLRDLAAVWPGESERWEGEVVAACGLQAAELTLRLIEDALADNRPAALSRERVIRYGEHLIDGFEVICRLLQRASNPPPALCRARNLRADELGGAAPSPGFAVLAQLDREQLDLITGRLSLAAAALPFDLGIEQHLRHLRRAARLATFAPPSQRARRPAMDYRAVVSPEVVYALRERAPCGPEDHLFSTAHQITECWLRVAHHYLAKAPHLARDGRWDDAADAITTACEVLPLAVQAGQLLDQMVLADYHPLRVRLRDGSGAQSSAARRLGPALHAAGAALWTALHFENLQVLDLLQQPSEHVDLYRYLAALKSAGKRIQAFLFQHYLLALGVLGTHSVGSLGYEIRTMAERAVAPVFPEINEAQHDYVMLSNFEHAEHSGAIVYRNELAFGWNPYSVADRPCQCPRDLMIARVSAYFRAIEDRDAEMWADLFDPVRGQLHDVPGTRPYLGKTRLRVFINGMFKAFSEMRATCSPPRIAGNNAIVEWRFDAVSYHGIPTTLHGREEFLLDDDGRILVAMAHWQPSVVAQQWQREMQNRTAAVPEPPHEAALRPAAKSWEARRADRHPSTRDPGGGHG